MGNNFIDLKQNDSLAFFRGKDLHQLLIYISSIFIEYRKTLGLPNYITFGTEIEYEKLSKSNTDSFIAKNLPKWISKWDRSVSSGGEINSPIMSDKEEYWEELKTICHFLQKNNADTLNNAGGHIHIGSQVLGTNIDAWRQFIKLYEIYEPILFRFLYGDKINARVRIMNYATPIVQEFTDLNFINKAKSYRDYVNKLDDRKYVALSLRKIDEDENTIEFRAPNATCNEIIWQNNINVLTKMLLTSRNNVLNEDFLDYKLNKITDIPVKTYLKICCGEIQLKEALEFCDLVFNNNLDKVYFLRQYLKNFESGINLKEMTLARKFTR